MANTMEHAIKHAISAALETMDAYRGIKDYQSCGQLADDLFEILFPGHVRTTPSADIVPQSVAEVTIPMAEPETKTVTAPVKAKKAPKEKEEKKADPVEDLTAKMEAVAIKDDASETSAKKARKPLTDEQKAAAKAKRDAKKGVVSPPPVADADEAKSVVVSAPAKPVKEKAVSKNNIDKLNPTQTKLLKKVADGHKVEVTKELQGELVEFLNKSSKEDFNAKKMEEHIAAFFKSRTPVVEERPARRSSSMARRTWSMSRPRRSTPR